MPTLDTLQLPRIDTSAYGGREAKKIAGHLYQVEEQLRYVLGHLDEDNLSEGLKSKIESGGMSSEILQSLDAVTLRVSGQDDAVSELRVGLGGITAAVQEQGGALTQLEQTAQGLAGTVQANKELSEQQAVAALETARKYTDTQLENYPTGAEMSSALQQTAESISATVAAAYSTKEETAAKANAAQSAAEKTAAADAAAKADAARDAAKGYTDDALTAYPTTVELQSTVEQRAESILSEVSAKYGTKEELHSTVEQTAGSILSTVADGYTSKSELRETVNGLRLTVENGDTSSRLTLTAGETELSSGTIELAGLVKITSLNNGETVVDGACVSTGVIESTNKTTRYDLNSGTIRMGMEGGDNVLVEKNRIIVYKSGNPSGVMYAGSGGAFFGGRVGSTYYGYVSSDTPSSSGFYGMCIDSGGVVDFSGGGTKVNIPGTGNPALNVSQYVSARGYRSWDDSTLQKLDVKENLGVDNTVSCRNLHAWDSKDRVLPTPYGTLRIAAMESPAPAFCDYGGGVCGADGLCCIVLDERYNAVTAANQLRRWILTDTSGGGHLWAEPVPYGAAVHGRPGQRFDWVCLSAQKGTGGEYAELCETRPPWLDPETPQLLIEAIDDEQHAEIRLETILNQQEETA